jgi:hypothetical protein
MSYTKPQSVYGDKQTFDPKVLSTPKFGDIVFDGSEFYNAGTQIALSDQEMLAYDLPKEPPQAATNLTFLINGSYYTYHPSNVLEKGLRVDNKQFYNPQVLKNLDQVYEQGQPVSLENVGWYDDFLKKNDLSTEGILLPAGELNFKVGPGGNWKVREIGAVSDGIRYNELTGIGKVGDEYVYTANVDPIDADSAYGYYDSTGTGRGEWTKKPSGGGILGDIGRAVASVPFGAEIAGLVTGNPYVYATLAGLRGGATGQDPLKVGLQTGLTVGIASSLGGAGGQPTGVEAGGADYSLTAGGADVGGTGFQSVGAEGFQAGATPSATSLLDTGLGTIDYNLLAGTAPGQLVGETGLTVGGEGLRLPTTPEVAGMGGGQGLTVPVAGGTITGAGFIPVGSTPALGDPSSFINDPNVLGQPVFSAGGSTLSLTDALRGMNLANQLMAGGQQPMGMPQQQAPFQPTGVDYSGILGLLGQRASVPGIQSLLGPAQIRYPNSLLG